MTETIGEQLRQAREARALSLEEVSRATHMRLHYLQALEAGDFNRMTSKAQARGFLRTYAGYLNLDPDTLLEALDSDTLSITSQPDPADAPGTPLTSAAIASPPPVQAVENGGSAPSEAVDAIFKTLGQRLQHQRELLGLSLEDVERHTHLRKHNLQALEAGNMERLPSPVQGRGMLNNYASFLGLDPDPLLLQFAEGLQARLVARQTAQPETRPKRARRWKVPHFVQRMFSGDILIGGTLTLFLIGFVIWGAVRIFAIRSVDAPEPTAPSIADVLLASPTPTETSTPIPPTPTRPLPPAVVGVTSSPQEDEDGQTTPPEDSHESVQIYITVRQRAWLRVLVDGDIEFEERVLPGSAYAFSGEQQIEILTGNGAALQIFYNQEDLGVMGVFGEVVNQVFTQEGVLTPTPTVTPTPTNTPRTTPTSEATETPTPARTPTVPALP